MNGLRVLVVEDGDEYSETLTRFVPGPEYVQVHSGSEALARLSSERFDVVYLDLRFDRIERSLLLGDAGTGTDREYVRLQNLQGLFILDALRSAGLGNLPVLLAAELGSAQSARIASAHPAVRFVPDGIRPEGIRSLLEAATTGTDRPATIDGR